MTGLIGTGDARLLSLILDAAECFQPMSDTEQEELLATAASCESIFG